MTSFLDSREEMIPTINHAMACAFAQDDIFRFSRIWRGYADAFMLNISVEFERGDWPDLSAIAERLGPDFVGLTSDTRKVVGWGEDNGKYREFKVYEQ